MNGVDWQAVRAPTRGCLPLLGSREDLNYLIGEMIAEMSNSHTYVAGGDGAIRPSACPTGLSRESTTASTPPPAAMYSRASTPATTPALTTAHRSREPGVDVRTGDFLLAIDGA